MFHTSDILRVHHGIPLDSFKENQQPASSTPTSKLLRKAFEAVHRPATEEPTFHTQPRQMRQKSATTIDPVSAPALRERRLESASTLRPARSRAMSSSTTRRPQRVQVYNEMLDEPVREQELVAPLHTYANAQQAEALAYSPILEQPIPVYDRFEELMRVSEEPYYNGVPSSIHSPMMSDLFVRPQGDFGPVSGRYDARDHASNTQDEEFAGFWRPNRLY